MYLSSFIIIFVLSSRPPDLRLDVSCQLRLPSITVCQQLLLIVKQLLVSLGCVLVVWPLNDCVYRASSLAITAIYAFRHIDIVSSCSSWSVWSWFTFNCDCLCWACGSA